MINFRFTVLRELVGPRETQPPAKGPWEGPGEVVNLARVCAGPRRVSLRFCGGGEPRPAAVTLTITLYPKVSHISSRLGRDRVGARARSMRRNKREEADAGPLAPSARGLAQAWWWMGDWVQNQGQGFLSLFRFGAGDGTQGLCSLGKHCNR